MANADPLFTIDFGAILAKLHLAGVQAIGNGSTYGWPINTGVDNSVHANPDNMPNGFVFDLKSNQFEFGLFQEIEYDPTVPEEFDNELKKLNKEKDKLNDDLKKLPATDSKNAESIADKIKKIDEDITKRKEELVKSNQAATAGLEKKKDDLKKTCFEGIKKYFEVFAGKMNAADIKEADLAIFQVSNKIKDNKDKHLVANGAIQAITDKELNAQNDENNKLLERNSNIKLKANYGYRVGFTVDTSAM